MWRNAVGQVLEADKAVVWNMPNCAKVRFDPFDPLMTPLTYYGSWALGKPFGLTAWLALCLPDGFACTKCAVVGDPFVKN
jgi:hypothetical protein